MFCHTAPQRPDPYAVSTGRPKPRDIGLRTPKSAHVAQTGSGGTRLRRFRREPDTAVILGQCQPTQRRVQITPFATQHPVQGNAGGGVAWAAHLSEHPADIRLPGRGLVQGGQNARNGWHGGFIAKQPDPSRLRNVSARWPHHPNRIARSHPVGPICHPAAIVQEHIKIQPLARRIKCTCGADRPVKRIFALGPDRAAIRCDIVSNRRAPCL
jgi:hypothetical protein